MLNWPVMFGERPQCAYRPVLPTRGERDTARGTDGTFSGWNKTTLYNHVISECIALLSEDSTATIDPDFAEDVQPILFE
jgi:hypothetical protein